MSASSTRARSTAVSWSRAVRREGSREGVIARRLSQRGPCTVPATPRPTPTSPAVCPAGPLCVLLLTWTPAVLWGGALLGAGTADIWGHSRPTVTGEVPSSGAFPHGAPPPPRRAELRINTCPSPCCSPPLRRSSGRGSPQRGRTRPRGPGRGGSPLADPPGCRSPTPPARACSPRAPVRGALTSGVPEAPRPAGAGLRAGPGGGPAAGRTPCWGRAAGHPPLPRRRHGGPTADCRGHRDRRPARGAPPRPTVRRARSGAARPPRGAGLPAGAVAASKAAPATACPALTRDTPIARHAEPWWALQASGGADSRAWRSRPPCPPSKLRPPTTDTWPSSARSSCWGCWPAPPAGGPGAGRPGPRRGAPVAGAGDPAAGHGRRLVAARQARPSSAPATPPGGGGSPVAGPRPPPSRAPPPMPWAVWLAVAVEGLCRPIPPAARHPGPDGGGGGRLAAQPEPGAVRTPLGTARAPPPGGPTPSRPCTCRPPRAAHRRGLYPPASPRSSPGRCGASTTRSWSPESTPARRHRGAGAPPRRPRPAAAPGAACARMKRSCATRASPSYPARRRRPPISRARFARVEARSAPPARPRATAARKSGPRSARRRLRRTAG